jgi:hypothetical protein
MHDLGLLTDWQHRSLYIEMSEKGYRRNEPNAMPRESSQVLPKVFDALSRDGVKRSDVADALGIPVEEIEKVVFGLTLTPLDGGQVGGGNSDGDGPRGGHLRVV